ncbi:transketolase [Helicobacter sp. MIT 14-3879]|uniref:transketolase n=1 Tax=Helicobacter sp. MIT 14-3879 TaxID=2040649 RepID=UPI000E1E95B0|nr:transketolase [Helicobacter sp. MIT 14-3879]RDU64006.1 transketolase [Helicobacter sp. MIT 14-3879]
MELETQMSNTLRFLSIDMIEKANSGHPGVAMGLSDIITIFSKHLIHNPKEPKWINRDRVVFSGGHGSALIYSFLHLCGYDISLEDLKNFRKLDSKTPGHPEYGLTSGIEITTGPLGQGVANAVGFAMAAKYAANLLSNEIINHKVYCFCGDGDLQEGISYEACSLAGVHKLDNLILIYDSNNITIEGDTSIAFNENIKMRFQAQGFDVLEINGHNFKEIDYAFNTAKTSTKPFLIIAKTKIAKGALELEGSHKSHGAPLGSDIIKRAKERCNFSNGCFTIPSSVKIAFESSIEVGDMHYKIWQDKLNKSSKKELLNELLNPNFDNITYPIFQKDIATRSSNGEILNAISKNLKGFIGGSADLAPSNNTLLKDSADFPNGANLHFGIREHAMGAIINAFSVYGIFIPYCATFFVFSDYMSPAVRIASISKLRVFYIWTHDSIGVGEDGATHQPIEQLSHFRAMPNLLVFRPADANENIECWKIALKQNYPSAFVLSRQTLPLLKSNDCSKGAYIIKDPSKINIILVASGSEVHLALEVAEMLESQNIGIRVISTPCFDLLLKQNKSFIESLFIPNIKVVAIEAARSLEWEKFADIVISMNSFGASGKGEEVFNKFGFNKDDIIKKIKENI